MGLSLMVGRSGWTSASPNVHTRQRLACTWADPLMPAMDSGEIAEGRGEMAVDEAGAEEGEGISGETSGADLPVIMTNVAPHRATMMTADLPQGIMMTVMLLLLIGMLTATALHPLVIMMIVDHLQDIMMIAMAAVAAAEEEADITMRGRTTEGAERTAMVVEGLIGTTASGTPTGMMDMVAQAMEREGRAPPVRSTGKPGHGGITEAEAGVMRGRQDLHCLQDQPCLQDTERGTSKNAFPRNKMNHKNDEDQHTFAHKCVGRLSRYICEIIGRTLSERFFINYAFLHSKFQ